MKKISFDRILYIIMSFLLLIFVGYISLANIIPFKYLVIIFIVMLLWDIILYFTLVLKNKKKKNSKRRIVGYIISFFLVLIMGIIGYYVMNTMNFFRTFGDNKYKEIQLLNTLQYYNFASGIAEQLFLKYSQHLVLYHSFYQDLLTFE